MAWIPDVPEEIDIQLQRAAFIKCKLVDQLPDELSTACGTGSSSTKGVEVAERAIVYSEYRS